MFIIKKEIKSTNKGVEHTSVNYLKSVYTSQTFDCIEHTLDIKDAIKFKTPKYAKKYLALDEDYELVEVK